MKITGIDDCRSTLKKALHQNFSEVNESSFVSPSHTHLHIYYRYLSNYLGLRAVSGFPCIPSTTFNDILPDILRP